MADPLTDLTQRTARLKGQWRPRNDKIKSWYNQLLMIDELKQEGMESFVSNDPRTAYNLALHLLTPSYIPYRVPTDPLKLSEIPGSSDVERALRFWWKRVDRFNRQRGRKGWLRELVSLILATGWYSVLALVLPPGEGREVAECVAEVWNPFDVYPEFDDSIGLTFVSHSYTLSRMGYMKKVKTLGWKQPTFLAEAILVDDCWYLDENSGAVTNAVIAGGRDWAKSPEVAREYDEIARLPVVMSPAGGLPDRGSILTDSTWKEHVGEALLATNEYILKSYNKQMSFILQLLRDTAQATSFEKTPGPPIIVPGREMDLYKRGGHFRMGVQDELGFLAKPPIPTEARTMLFDSQQMIQRGALPWILFGNIQMQVTGYLISQVAATAHQALDPYGESTADCISDICNLWLEVCKSEGLAPWDIKAPQLPPGIEVEVDLRIHIPGDVTQRATVARMLNPEFRLPQTLIYDLLFPEVTDPTDAQQKVATEDALMHPVAKQLEMIGAFQEHARVLQANGDSESAQRFDAAARMLAQELTQGAQGEQTPEQLSVNRRPKQPRQEVMPREMMESQMGPMGGGMPSGGVQGA